MLFRSIGMESKCENGWRTKSLLFGYVKTEEFCRWLFGYVKIVESRLAVWLRENNWNYSLTIWSR